MLNPIVQQLADSDLLQLRENLKSLGPADPPALQINLINDYTTYTGSYIGGLSYPIKLDGQGGLSLSFGDQRITEQITEVLETSIGERIWRQFFGMPDILFESISEDILASMVKKQLMESISSTAAVDYQIDMRATEDGDMIISVSYAIQDRNTRNNLTYKITL